MLLNIASIAIKILSLILLLILGLENLKKGEKVSVCVIGNPLPFAVGKSEVDWAYISEHGRRGKGVSVCHLFGDFLWAAGGASVPNEGYSLHSGHISSILKTTALQTYNESEDHTTKDTSAVDSNNDAAISVQRLSLSDEGKALPTSNIDNNTAEETTDQLDSDRNNPSIDIVPSRNNITEESGENVDSSVNVEEIVIDSSEKSNSVSTAEVDELLVTCFLRALKFGVKDKDLPMLVSTFWSILLRYVHTSM